MNPGKQSQVGELPGSGLKPPVKAQGPANNDRNRRGVVWVALVVMIFVSLAVLLVLPGLVPEKVDLIELESPGANAVAGPGLSTSAKQESGITREQAGKALQTFLLARARLELANAPSWGAAEWPLAMDTAARGNDFFSQRQFDDAHAAFPRSLELLLTLESQKEQRLAAALNEGWKAMELNDSVSAVAYFDTA